MMTLELSSPSYTGYQLKLWAEENEYTNEIASRLIRKYFNGDNDRVKKSSFYTVTLTNNGGVILKKAAPQQAKARVS